MSAPAQGTRTAALGLDARKYMDRSNGTGSGDYEVYEASGKGRYDDCLQVKIKCDRCQMIHDLNPYLPSGGFQRVFDLTFDLLMRINRMGHVQH